MAQALVDSSEVLDLVACNIVMKAHARAGDCLRCLAVLRDMNGHGIAPDAISYGIALDACVNAEDLTEAERLYGEMRKSGHTSSKICQTSLMRGLAAAGRLGEAKALLEEMKADVIAYSTLMRALCSQRGRAAEAVDLLEQMVSRGIQADDMALNIVLMGCSSDGDAVAAMRVFRLATATDARVAMSASTLSVFLKAMRNGSALEEAVAAFESAQEIGLKGVQIRHYTQLASACAQGRLHQLLRRVFDGMVRFAENTGQTFDEATVQHISGSCRR